MLWYSAAVSLQIPHEVTASGDQGSVKRTFPHWRLVHRARLLHHLNQASSCLSVLCGTFMCLLDRKSRSRRRFLMVRSQRRGYISSDTIRCDTTAPGSHSRDSVVSLLCCLIVTATLGTICDIPGLSVPGYQPGNRFVHTENQTNIMTRGPWLNHANGSVQIT